VGLQISDGQVSNRLSKDQTAFHVEKAARYQAGLARSPWQPLDATRTRVDGQNGDCPIVCTPLSTAYCTTAAQDRLTSIDVLTNHRPRRVLVKTEALGYGEASGLSAIRCRQLAPVAGEGRREEAQMPARLETHRPGLGPQQRKWLLDATAGAASHADAECPVVRLWVCEDAPPFPWLPEERARCWVHAGRHETKLRPSIPDHQRLREVFVQRCWAYYAPWLAYRPQPKPEAAARLARAFDAVCTTVTGYNALDERMAKTHAKKGCLRMVLAHPEMPLHNNPAELGARARVRKRDVRFGPRTREGAQAWDPFRTLAETATKRGVSFYHSIHDRVSGACQMPSLADLIEARAQGLNLGASWNTS
jgi:hypothetical protein